ncbi:MAG TPA: acetyl-CoA carboxylase biotin carboxylase subunit, partial [Silvibacterium sp.]|nr:acetyl-CoA carboxylase biotin carboxylase subunit [Silvibacterium sp.]
FRRILDDADFRAARIDTGYLDRLLAESAPIDVRESEAGDETLAAVAAALFEAQRSAPASAATKVASAWKSAARREGLRG